MKKYTPIINQISAIFKLKDNFPYKIKEVEVLVDKITKNLRLNVVRKTYFSFKPMGITYVCILSQSSLSVHTWPEDRLIHVDLASCSKLNEDDLKKALINSLPKGSIVKLKVKKMQKLTLVS
jgi:S-adenosylmethionine/arginine decarboxylase-like enzyme